MKSLNLSNKIEEFKQTESIFPRNQLSDLIIDKLREIMQLQSNIKLDNLEYTTKRGKRYNFSRYSTFCFLRGIYMMEICH